MKRKHEKDSDMSQGPQGDTKNTGDAPTRYELYYSYEEGGTRTIHNYGYGELEAAVRALLTYRRKYPEYKDNYHMDAWKGHQPLSRSIEIPEGRIWVCERCGRVFPDEDVYYDNDGGEYRHYDEVTSTHAECNEPVTEVDIESQKPNLIKCVNCGLKILETEPVCPWCGEDPRSPADNSTETTEDAMQTYTFKVKTDLPDEIKVQADCENDAIDEAEHKLAMLLADNYEPPVDIEGPVETMETTEGKE